ncbi:MAG: DUF3093 domain-containing protein [Aquiluna sp.]
MAIYRERLYPSFSFVLALTLSGPMVLLAALPFGLPLAIALALLVPLMLNIVVFLLSPVIQVSGGHLEADRIRIPVSALGKVLPLDGAQFNRKLGPEADPRAQLMIRGYVKGGAQIPVLDPEDPTPYLLLSSRKPKELAVALEANRA